MRKMLSFTANTFARPVYDVVIKEKLSGNLNLSGYFATIVPLMNEENAGDFLRSCADYMHDHCEICGRIEVMYVRHIPLSRFSTQILPQGFAYAPNSTADECERLWKFYPADYFPGVIWEMHKRTDAYWVATFIFRTHATILQE